MKLYYYDHCPFCTRVRMLLGLRDIPYDAQVLANDDEKTPTDLIGKKMLPILIKKDGQAMGESLDILDYIDEISEGQLAQEVRPDIQDWVERVSQYSGHLTMPRSVKVGLEEFADDSAVAYFIAKKTEWIGDFDESLRRSDEYINKLNADLKKLDALILSSEAANGSAFSMEDIHLFPLLRNLTVIKGVDWPGNVRAYLESMSKKTQVPLFFDRAI